MRVARATVDRDALRHNLAVARNAAPRAKVFAVVKANAYGHGLVPVAETLAPAADGFAVSCLEEALVLREAGYAHRVLLLEGAFSPDEIDLAAAQRLDLVVHSDWQLADLAACPPRRPLCVWMKVDTGMNRLGFAAAELPAVRRRLQGLPGVAGIGHFTHLPCADDRGAPQTRKQLAAFDGATAAWEGERSAANSAGTLAWPATHYDWVRPGIALYGAAPFIDGGARPDLRPVMTLRARLIGIRRQQAGDAVGYGGTFTCPEAMPVGTVSIGYGDGYPRHAPATTPALVRGVRVTLAGRVSMDMLAVDLRRCPEARIGDEVTLWGEGLPAEEVAAHCGTIAYELFCQVTQRVRFHYVDGGVDGQDSP